MLMTYKQMIERWHQYIETTVLKSPPTLVLAHLRGENFVERDTFPFQQHGIAAIDEYELDTPLSVGGRTTIIEND